MRELTWAFSLANYACRPGWPVSDLALILEKPCNIFLCKVLCHCMQDMKEDERSAKQSLQALSKELKVQDEAVTAFREVTRSILSDSWDTSDALLQPPCNMCDT